MLKLMSLFSEVQYENECGFVEATLTQYCQWLDCDQLPNSNPLAALAKDQFWCYADYKYMKDIVTDQPQLLKVSKFSTHVWGKGVFLVIKTTCIL